MFLTFVIENNRSSRAIFLLPVLSTLATFVLYIWECTQRDQKSGLLSIISIASNAGFGIPIRMASNFFSITEMILACFVWVEYGNTKEIVDQNSSVRTILLFLVILAFFHYAIRLFFFHKKVSDNDLQQNVSWVAVTP